MENLDNVMVSEGIYGVTILVGFKSRVLDNKELQWHIEDEGEDERHISLKEIYEQLKAKGYEGVIYVWQETPLSGIIYECGNYEEGQWVRHGTTRGYA